MIQSMTLRARKLLAPAALAALAACATFSGSGAANAQSAGNFVPARIYISSLANAGAGSKICVLGFSQSTSGPPAVSAYQMTVASGVGVWSTLGPNGTTIRAYDLNDASAPIKYIDPAPRTPGASLPWGPINSARVQFFIVKNGASVNCSGISFSVDGNGNINSLSNPSNYVFPSGLVEWSVYQANGTTGNLQMTIDTSNVDNFQSIVKLTVDGARSPARVYPSSVGNPAQVSGVTFSTAFNAFRSWLSAQTAPANEFARLAYGASTYPYKTLVSPNDYLAVIKCAKLYVSTSSQTARNYPLDCDKADANGNYAPGQGPNAYVNYPSPLNSYYEGNLKRFFDDAMRDPAKPLRVMADAPGGIPSQQWKVVSNRANCPIYLTPDRQSLKFQGTVSTTNSFILCNPVGQVRPLPVDSGASGLPSVASTQTNGVTTTYMLLSAAQTNLIKGLPAAGVGWNIGQPDTGWVGQITGFDTSVANKVYVTPAIQAKPGTDFQQAACASSCGLPNIQYKLWVVSNVPVASKTNWFETGSQMVFANDGMFAAWLTRSSSTTPSSSVVMQQVAASVARNIAEAFNRGIENCNNVTMPTPNHTLGSIAPNNCARAAILSKASYLPAVYGTQPDRYPRHDLLASDAWWSNQANFYPAGGHQNYYAQFLHTVRLDSAGAVVNDPRAAGRNLFYLPNGGAGAWAKSAQQWPMGAAYGFGFDENPTYLTANAPAAARAQVSSKYDPIAPNGNFTTAPTVVRVTIGPVQ